MDRYLEIAHVHAKRLQNFESAKSHVEIVEEGSEPPDFWDSGRANPDINPEWDNWYPQLDSVQDQDPKSWREVEEEDVKDEGETRPSLYCYPEITGLTGFDYEDLIDDGLQALCCDKRCFLWKGYDFIPDQMSEAEFIAQVKESYWSDTSNIEVIWEVPGDESQEFSEKIDGY